LFMVQNDNDVFNDKNPSEETYVKYKEGYVPHLRVNDNAQQCGIGKILMILCFNEEIHKVLNNPKNEAAKRLETNAENKQLKPKASRLKQWAMSNCNKLVYLMMAVEGEKDTAHVYFNSAIESGYTEMFIQLSLFDPDGFYPKKSDHSPTSELKKQYTDDGCMKEGDGVDDKECDVHGGTWFFCQPIPPQ